MLDAEVLDAIVRQAEMVPERYRVALFEHLLKATGATATKATERSDSQAGATPSPDAQNLLTTSPRSDIRLLAAIALADDGDGAALNELSGVYKRYRVKPPSNISRDVSSLIRKGLVLELSRDGRSPRIGLTATGTGALRSGVVD